MVRLFPGEHGPRGAAQAKISPAAASLGGGTAAAAAASCHRRRLGHASAEPDASPPNHSAEGPGTVTAAESLVTAVGEGGQPGPDEPADAGSHTTVERHATEADHEVP